MAVWRECKLSSCHCQDNSSCGARRLALTGHTLMGNLARLLTPGLNQPFTLSRVDEAWFSCSFCQGGPLHQEVTVTRTRSLGDRKIPKPVGEGSLTGIKSTLHYGVRKGGVGNVVCSSYREVLLKSFRSLVLWCLCFLCVHYGWNKALHSLAGHYRDCAKWH